MEGSLMTEAQSKIRISVRNLVEFVLRSGDLDNRRSQGGKKRLCRRGAGCTERSRNAWERITVQKLL